MLRLTFTEADLRRITFAPEPNAVFETALSVRLLSSARGGGRWRPGARRPPRGDLPARSGVIKELVSADGFVPDFLLQPDCHDFAAAVERIGQIPADRIAAEVGLLSARDPSRGLRELAAGSDAGRRTLTTDLRAYFASSLAPMWPAVRAAAAADRSVRLETLLRGGLDAMLATLSVTWRWDPPVLHIPSAHTYDVRLCGRGLLLIPSYFAPSPVLTYRPDDSTVLVYPICRGEESSGSADALGPLLGRTRAAVLAALRVPATTTALAERVGISLPSASQHATVLRNAGLIRTSRIGGAVLHTLTPSGESLLRGDPAAR
ncbi:ArsR/SmtB family transcription factor [Nonomuraea harbinensis]|uniref:ArsR/SmtB family transcription factor n=1 Tax=Nonomuraea harbinensis TaxID=1286938 RepID=A0ABW1C202_9ACTN|nr:winged helix-turn-helix domain-containing protein [Nonomuraea harbinensis]